MGEIADASAQREEHAGKETHLHRTTASTSAAASTVIGHLQQEGSDQGLCGCSCCTIHLCSRNHLLGCGSNRQVIMLRSEGLGVPLGSSRGPGSASGGLWGPCGSKIRRAQNRIIRSNLKNTVKYVINTIRRIIRLRRMTHPCSKTTKTILSSPVQLCF